MNLMLDAADKRSIQHHIDKFRKFKFVSFDADLTVSQLDVLWVEKREIKTNKNSEKKYLKIFIFAFGEHFENASEIVSFSEQKLDNWRKCSLLQRKKKNNIERINFFVFALIYFPKDYTRNESRWDMKKSFFQNAKSTEKKSYKEASSSLCKIHLAQEILNEWNAYQRMNLSIINKRIVQ